MDHRRHVAIPRHVIIHHEVHPRTVAEAVLHLVFATAPAAHAIITVVRVPADRDLVTEEVAVDHAVDHVIVVADHAAEVVTDTEGLGVAAEDAAEVGLAAEVAADQVAVDRAVVTETDTRAADRAA